MMPIPIGANAENVVDFKAKLGRPLDYCRVFMQTQDWNVNDSRIKEALAAKARGEKVVVSIKVTSVQNALSGGDDARMTRILNGFNGAGLTGLVFGVFHEPEDDVEGGTFSSTQWRQMQAHMLPLAKNLIGPKGGRTISILMSYTANPSSGRNPQDFHVPEADIQGWDIYERAGGAGSGESWATSDPSTKSVASLWGPCFDLSKQWGKPSMVCEFGVLRRQSDTSGAERGKYFKNVAAWSRISEAQAVIYYEVGPPRFNYAFRTEQAGVDGFKAIADAAGGTPPPPPPPPPGDCDECEAALATAEAQVSSLTAERNSARDEVTTLKAKITKAQADLA